MGQFQIPIHRRFNARQLAFFFALLQKISQVFHIWSPINQFENLLLNLWLGKGRAPA
jgi:hypothetical protein